jgi:diacylglycerol kinase family enzyme
VAPGVLARALARGLRRTPGHKGAPSPDVAQLADLTSIVVTAPRPFPWQVDGDYLGETDRLEIGYNPGALTVVVP